MSDFALALRSAHSRHALSRIVYNPSQKDSQPPGQKSSFHLGQSSQPARTTGFAWTRDREWPSGQVPGRGALGAPGPCRRLWPLSVNPEGKLSIQPADRCEVVEIISPLMGTRHATTGSRRVSSILVALCLFSLTDAAQDQASSFRTSSRRKLSQVANLQHVYLPSGVQNPLLRLPLCQQHCPD